MAERIDITVPEPEATQWVVQGLNIRRGMTAAGGVITMVPSDSQITVRLMGNNGRVKSHEWNGVPADALIVALNKANLSAGNTLNKRILDKIIADNMETGVSTGAAD